MSNSNTLNAADSQEFKNPSVPDASTFDPASLFDARDVELVQDARESMELRKAALALMQSVMSGPLFNIEFNGNPTYGRFLFTSHSRTAAEAHAAIRLCRVALDFLEQDLSACEDEAIAYYSRQVEAFKTLREGGSL